MKHAEDKNGGDGVQQSQVSSSEPGPSILANNVIGPLLLEALDGFLFMVSCNGEVEFVSENVTNYLRYQQADLIGKSIYTIIHPDDQLDFSTRLAPLIERSRTASNDRPASRSISFTCRLQVKPNDTSSDSGSVVRIQVSQYEKLQILALLQPYPHDREGRDVTPGCSHESGNQYFLACIARRLNVMERTPVVHDIAQFLTKQDLKGKILACDTSRFSSDQLSLSAFIGHNIKDFCHHNDISQLDRHHNEVLRIGTNLSGVYRMQLAPGHYVFVQTKSKLFKNSASGLPEFIMSTHSIVRKCDKDSELNGSASNSLMKALIGKSIPISKPRENASKSHDSKALQSSGMYNSSTNGLMPSSCLGSGGGNNVNDLDIDRLSSVSDIGDVSEINDLLEILHRQDSTSSGGGSGALNFDLLSSNPFGGLDDVTPLMQEVLRQSPVTVDRRLSTPTGGSMSRASALMPNNDQNGQTSDMQHSSGNQLPQFGDGGLTDDDVTTLLFNLLPSQQQQPVHHQPQTQMNQRHGSCHLLQQQQSLRPPASNSTIQTSSNGLQRLSLGRRRCAAAASSPAPGGAGVSPPLLSLRHSVTSPNVMLNSPLTTGSPAVPLNMLSSPASVSSPWPQSSPGMNDEPKSVSLLEQFRRVKGLRMPPLNTNMVPRSSEGAVNGTGTPAGTPLSASSNVGLKDLLLSNDDDDDVSSKSDGPLSRSNSRLSDTPSGSALNNRSFLFPSSDSSAESRKRHASASDRPDSSTKSAKPNVLLMKLLSGQDEGENEGDSSTAATAGAVSSNANNGNASKPTSSVMMSPDAEDRRDGASAGSVRFMDGRKDSSSESTQPRNNNLLRQLLNEDKDEGHSPQSPRPLKLLEKLMSSEVSQGTACQEKPSSVTQHSPNGTQQSSVLKSPASRKIQTKDEYRVSAEDNEKMKKLQSLWDRSDSSSVAPRTNKRKVDVMETQADSTDDSIAASSTSGAGASERTAGGARKLQRKDILLTRLLSTSHPTVEPVLNARTISAIAVDTPQMNLMRRPTSEFDTISGAVQSNVKSSNAPSRSGSSNCLPSSDRDSRVGLTSSLLNVESNLQIVSMCDVESDDDLTNMLHSIATPMENDAAASGEETALLSQLERILNSPSIALSELDSLLGDNSIDPGASLSSKPVNSGLSSGSSEQAAVREATQSHVAKDSQPPAPSVDMPVAKPARKLGAGLLQQLLGGHDDVDGSRTNQTNSSRVSDGQRYRTSTQNEPTSSASCNDVSSSRMCATSMPSASPGSGSGQSASANVAAFIQKLAAQAARNSSSNNNAQQISASDRRGSNSRQSSMNFIQPDCISSQMNNLNDLLNVTIPPNVIAPTNSRNQRLPMPVPASFSSTIQSNNVRGAGHNVPPAPTTTAGSRPLDEYPRQTMNTAMMAGGAIVQNSGVDMMSGQSHSHSLSFTMSSPLFSTDRKSPQSTASGTSNRDLPSPFGSLSHISNRAARSGLQSSPAYVNNSHSGGSSYVSQSSVAQPVQFHDVKQEKSCPERRASKVMQAGDSSGRMAMQSGNMSMARRGSCSVEVIQGLRDKCHARSQSIQQRHVNDPSAYSSVTSSGHMSETSELPPDILQSLTELTEQHNDCLSSVVDNPVSGRQSAAEVNGSLEELLAGLSDDIDEGRGLFGQLNDPPAMMEQAPLKQECMSNMLSDMCQMPDQRLPVAMNHPQMGHCDPGHAPGISGGQNWSQHSSVDQQTHLRLSAARSNQQQQFHHQQPQQQLVNQQRFDQQAMVGQQFPVGGVPNLQDVMSGSASPGMVPNQTTQKPPVANAQYRHQSGGVPQQVHVGVMNPQHQQSLSHDTTGRLMHSQSNAMMSSMTSNNQQHRSHRLVLNQSQSSAGMMAAGQLMPSDCGGRIPSSAYMVPPSQPNQRSGGNGMMLPHQREMVRDHAMHGHQGMGVVTHGQPGPSHKLVNHMPLMHGNNDMAVMQGNQSSSSRMMSNHSGMMHGSTGPLQHQPIMHNQSAMIQSPSGMQQNQFKPMMNQPAMMTSQPGSGISQSRSLTQGQSMVAHPNQMGALSHHQSGMLPSNRPNHSEMLMNQPGMVKNHSASLRNQTDVMMNQPRMTHQTASPGMKNYPGMMSNQMDMMQSNHVGSGAHHMLKHHQQVRDTVAQQLPSDASDMPMDVFSWLSSDQGLSAELLAADAQNASAPVQVSPPKPTSGNFAPSFGGEHFSTMGQQNGPGADPGMPTGSSSLDFLTNPSGFLNRVHEDGFSSRQQMLQIAMAPDSNEGKSGRHMNSNLYRRQPSVNATGTSPLMHSGNVNVSSAASGNANAGRFHSGLSRDQNNMGGVVGRSMTSMHPGSSRVSTDLPHEVPLSQPGPELSGRRLQQQQQQQQVNCSAVSSLSVGGYQNTPDLDDSANDSLMSQLFGTPASSMSAAGQGDMCSSTLVSRSLQPCDNNPMDSDANASSAGVHGGSGGTDERKSMESRHGSNSLLQQLLSD